MPIPTSDPIARVLDPSDLRVWSTRLVEYLDKNLREWIMPPQRITLVNGDNANVDVKGGNQVQLTGPTGAFAITGIAGGSAGRTIILINDTVQVMTIRNNNAGSSGPNRILTFSGDTVATIVMLTYDNFNLVWKTVSLR